MAEHRHSEGSERAREVIRDGFTIMLGAASWAFEQGDRMIDNWLHRGQASREEGRRRLDEFAARTRQAGEDLSRRLSDSMRTARSSMPLATRDQVASLERRIDELTREIQSLRGGEGAARAKPPERGRTQT